jgi:hypothetical protein
MDDLKREAITYLGGALLVLVGIAIFLWVTDTGPDLLHGMYGIM